MTLLADLIRQKVLKRRPNEEFSGDDFISFKSGNGSDVQGFLFDSVS